VPGSRKTLPESSALPPERRVITVSPDDVLQPDRRPWARLSLDRVVIRAVLGSAATLGAVLVIVALVTRFLGLW
jgi:hypothetical protein